MIDAFSSYWFCSMGDTTVCCTEGDERAKRGSERDEQTANQNQPQLTRLMWHPIRSLRVLSVSARHVPSSA